MLAPAPAHYRSNSPLDVINAIANPASWDALGAEQLRAVAFVRLAAYGRTQDARESARSSGCTPCCRRTRRHGQPASTSSGAVSQFIEEGKTSTLALLPFVLADTDAGIISTATIDTASAPNATFEQRPVDRPEAPRLRNSTAPTWPRIAAWPSSPA
jgi:hypothetical protein